MRLPIRRSADILPRLAEKLLERIIIAGLDECWEWQGATPDHGYGMVQLNIPAHRLAYILWNGEIPEDLHIDHTCENRRCANPHHLDAVTQGENNRRIGVRRTTCKSGLHPWVAENIEYVNRGGKRRTKACRPCRVIRNNKTRMTA